MPQNMLSDEVVESIAAQMALRMSAVETQLLKTIGRRIREIGMILPSDATRLAALRDIGADIAKINAFLRRQTQLNQAELDTIYKAAAKANERFNRRFYQARGISAIPFEKNVVLQNLVAAESQITAQAFANISQSTVIAGGQDDTFVPIAEGYQQIVDRAITAARNGISSYNESMRDALKTLARSGIQTVEYASGQHRRVDSAVRMNIVDGVRAVNQKVTEMAGKQFGADGIELTAHNTCAPDHLPMQGRQFSNDEYAKLQNQQPSKDYQGRTYDAIQRPIGMWNCRHFAYPIILGVSKPIHSDEELDRLKQINETTVRINGKDYTPYEASQLMRKVETEIRKAKNEATLYEASGDTQAETAAKQRVRELENAYDGIAKQADMRKKYARIKAV